jgi:hypothetical protein
MHILLAIGVSMLQVAAPPPTLLTVANANTPISVTFNETAPFGDAISMLAKVSGVPIAFDETVPEQLRRQPMTDSKIVLKDVNLEQAVAFLVERMGLSYIVLEGKSIRIFTKA